MPSLINSSRAVIIWHRPYVTFSMANFINNMPSADTKILLMFDNRPSLVDSNVQFYNTPPSVVKVNLCFLQ